jgi:arsenate reductase (thioredoxin)
MKKNKTSVLFLCAHNSCRSQMAEGLLRFLYRKCYDSYSAGVEQTKVHPLALHVMKEVGIDISNQYSKTVEQYEDRLFDVVVTVCDTARETCPFFPGKKLIHQSFDDPSEVEGTDEEKLNAFRTVRDEIETWIKYTFSCSESLIKQISEG